MFMILYVYYTRQHRKTALRLTLCNCSSSIWWRRRRKVIVCTSTPLLFPLIELLFLWMNAAYTLSSSLVCACRWFHLKIRRGKNLRNQQKTKRVEIPRRLLYLSSLFYLLFHISKSWTVRKLSRVSRVIKDSTTIKQKRRNCTQSMYMFVWIHQRIYEKLNKK